MERQQEQEQVTPRPCSSYQYDPEVDYAWLDTITEDSRFMPLDLSNSRPTKSLDFGCDGLTGSLSAWHELLQITAPDDDCGVVFARGDFPDDPDAILARAQRRNKTGIFGLRPREDGYVRTAETVESSIPATCDVAHLRRGCQQLDLVPIDGNYQFNRPRELPSCALYSFIAVCYVCRNVPAALGNVSDWVRWGLPKPLDYYILDTNIIADGSREPLGCMLRWFYFQSILTIHLDYGLGIFTSDSSIQRCRYLASDWQIKTGRALQSSSQSSCIQQGIGSEVANLASLANENGIEDTPVVMGRLGCPAYMRELMGWASGSARPNWSLEIPILGMGSSAQNHGKIVIETSGGSPTLAAWLFPGLQKIPSGGPHLRSFMGL